MGMREKLELVRVRRRLGFMEIRRTVSSGTASPPGFMEIWVAPVFLDLLLCFRWKRKTLAPEYGRVQATAKCHVIAARKIRAVMGGFGSVWL